MFFLRDILQDAGWDKVLLITPSQLFRDYSSDLIRRYNLETVKNMSLASFYKQLLESFDRRFLGRQYVFEFTEEYLPDEYLKKIYSPEQISNIDSEIDNAIKKYVADACKLLEIKLPKEININFIKLLRDKLSATIAEIYQNEKTFSSDIGYKEHVKEINSLDKQVSEYQKKYELGVASKEKLYVGKNVVDELFAICQKAKEISSLKKIEEYQAFELFSEFRLYIQKFSKYDISCGPLNKLRTYNMLLTETLDKISLKGNRVISEQNDDALVKNVFEVCKTAIYGITQNKNIKQWLENRQKLIEKNELRLKKYSDNIKEINHLIEYNLSWFKEHNYDKSKINRDIYRTKLEKSKYVLSRIESTIFENEVWNAIAPLKNKYNIANIKEERLLDGHKKQYKILYKADLLFYLMIYCKLHKKHFGPKYSLICIDEGQDLHPADYKIIKTLYPLATLNVFGDVNQVIHDECGISDWQTETGIDNLFELNNNYRNNAAIVDFCNKNFGSNMIYNEKISSSKYPKILLSVKQINKAVNFDTVVIVKNKAMYEEFITLNIDFKEKLVYIDTLSEKVPNGCVLCYSIFAAKGLEFRSALVYSKEMTTNQKVVACTRATDELFYFG